MKRINIVDMRIEVLNLSPRTYNTLMRSLPRTKSSLTIKEILCYCAGDANKILNLKKFDIRAKNELMDAITRLAIQMDENIYLGMPIEEIKELCNTEEIITFPSTEEETESNYIKKMEELKTEQETKTQEIETDLEMLKQSYTRLKELIIAKEELLKRNKEIDDEIAHIVHKEKYRVLKRDRQK